MLLTKKSYFIINESINIKENKELERAILFTDIVESSKSWKNDPLKMITTIEEQSKLIDKWANENKGFICKTIGDAYMISFKDIQDAIECALNIQEDLKENPIDNNGTGLKLRIGIAFGQVYESIVTLQDGIKLKDYFGNTVNTAARLESKVSPEEGFAFTLLSNNIEELILDKVLDNYETDLISFKNKGDEPNRSQRLLTDIHRYYHKSIKELKGIEEIDVYNVKIK